MAIKKYYVTVDDLGNTRWYKDAKCKVLHRENGPAVDCTNGHKEWWQNDLLHRTDGPAIEWWDGDKFWWQNGLLHRTDGPAIEWNDSDEWWFINGERLSKGEFNLIVEQNV